MKNISFNELLEKYNSDKHVILDIRVEQKFLQHHVPGAINLMIKDILAKPDYLLDKNKEIYVYCNSGNSSKLATNILSDLGYNAFNLNGGFSEYISSKK